MHDKKWEHSLKDAIIFNSPYMLRHFFAVMIHRCEISEPMRLWNLYKENLSEYLLYKAKLINIYANYNE